jgi:hypothetical protein
VSAHELYQHLMLIHSDLTPSYYVSFDYSILGAVVDPINMVGRRVMWQSTPLFLCLFVMTRRQSSTNGLMQFSR